MDTMKHAFEKAGFDAFVKVREAGGRRRWLAMNGLLAVAPVKEVKLHLGVKRTEGGVTVCEEQYVVRRKDRRD